MQLEPLTLYNTEEAIKISEELLKQGGKSFKKTLHQLICKRWKEEEMLCDRSNSIIYHFYEKGVTLTSDN
jgi:hypothetical protein